jgi:hypothetical protein
MRTQDLTMLGRPDDEGVCALLPFSRRRFEEAYYRVEVSLPLVVFGVACLWLLGRGLCFLFPFMFLFFDYVHP